jgi:energy-coupling factor transporter transmembrane protein EcfT
VGEGYLNFSWPGVFATGIVMAFLTRRLDRWFLPRIQGNIIWAVFWATLSYRFVWVSLPFNTLVSEFLLLFGVMYLLNRFLSHGRYRVRKVGKQSEVKHLPKLPEGNLP